MRGEREGGRLVDRQRRRTDRAHCRRRTHSRNCYIRKAVTKGTYFNIDLEGVREREGGRERGGERGRGREREGKGGRKRERGRDRQTDRQRQRTEHTADGGHTPGTATSETL